VLWRKQLLEKAPAAFLKIHFFAPEQDQNTMLQTSAAREQILVWCHNLDRIVFRPLK
jgi:hypothetical protein